VLGVWIMTRRLRRVGRLQCRLQTRRRPSLLSALKGIDTHACLPDIFIATVHFFPTIKLTHCLNSIGIESWQLRLYTSACVMATACALQPDNGDDGRGAWAVEGRGDEFACPAAGLGRVRQQWLHRRRQPRPAVRRYSSVDELLLHFYAFAAFDIHWRIGIILLYCSSISACVRVLHFCVPSLTPYFSNSVGGGDFSKLWLIDYVVRRQKIWLGFESQSRQSQCQGHCKVKHESKICSLRMYRRRRLTMNSVAKCISSCVNDLQYYVVQLLRYFFVSTKKQINKSSFILPILDW